MSSHCRSPYNQGVTVLRAVQEHPHAPLLPTFFKVMDTFGVAAVDLSPVLGSRPRVQAALEEAGFADIKVSLTARTWPPSRFC